MILFRNSSPLDIRAVTTLGVNVKTDSNAIGYFGTGLKYAIAVLLREDQSISISSDNKIYDFSTKTEEVRGVPFNFIDLTTISPGEETKTTRLGFTTELGKNWTLLEAYRELWSNCMDEKGKVEEIDDWVSYSKETRIYVAGDAFSSIHAQRSTFLLPERTDKKLLFSTPNLQVYDGYSNSIFYKGIAAYKLPCRSRFTYNLTSTFTLTEDRTIRDTWSVHHTLAKDLITHTPIPLLPQILDAADFFENTLDFDWSALDYSDEVLNCMEGLVRARALTVNKTLSHILSRHRPKERIEPTQTPLSPTEKRLLNDAIITLVSVGYPITDYPIICSNDLPEGVLALAFNNKIFLSLRCFSEGILYEALLEEFVHLRYNVFDNTREMQNVLFRELVTQIKRTR